MILIAIGANLPGPGGQRPLQTGQDAVRAVRLLLPQHRSALSRWYRTAPVPPSGQPPYVNAVLRIDAGHDPAALLQALHEIEVRYGRERSLPNAARTLDLDIVAMAALVRTAPDPVLPHPRMHQRAFVLQPMLDVAAGWRHPILHLTTAELLARLSPYERGSVLPIEASHLRDDGVPPT